MIEAKETLIGNIASSSSLSGSLNKATEYIDPITQEKVTTPTKEEQVLTPDDGYTGLSKVTVNPIPDNYIEPNGTIDITKDGQYNVSQYANANVDFDTSDATAEAGDIASGKTAYIGDGLVTGTGVLAPTIEKGLRIDGYAEDGYANEVTILGMTSIPGYYMGYAGYLSGYRGWFSGANAKINLPNNITKIDNYAFAYNETLTEINLSDSITTMGAYAFMGCKELVLNKLPESITSIGNSCFFGNAKLTITKIPKGVRGFQAQTFYNCTGLTELTFEGNISNLNITNLFRGCTNLKKLSFPNNTTVPSVGSNALNGVTLEVVEVPSALVDAWKAKSYWSDFADIIVGI